MSELVASDIRAYVAAWAAEAAETSAEAADAAAFFALRWASTRSFGGGGPFGGF